MRHLPALAVLACGLLLGLPPVGAQEDGAQKESSQAERQLQQVREELEEIAGERRKLETRRGAAARALRKVDEQVGETSRELARIQADIRQQQAALAELQENRETLRERLSRQRAALAAQLRAAYVLGEDAPLKLLLAQDRVADGQRLLAYHRYIQQARTARITALTTQMRELEVLENKIAAQRAALDIALAKQHAQLKKLQLDRGKRAGTVAQLDARYRDRGERQEALGRDEKALEKLLAKLRAAAAEAAARRRAAAAARAAHTPDATPATQPPAAWASAIQVGGLSWPLSGALLADFGGQLPDGRRSDGVLIGAQAGTPVTAVAGGRVVFADWMTGYGLIMILDHGNGYMSLYAHNDALLRDVGDTVQRGDTLARVGTSGGEGRPALYFELRRNGDPVDPGEWLRRR